MDSSPSGSVKVTRDERAVRFEIDDDGAGISSALRDAVRLRGVRLDQSTAGSGLGLAIVNDILDAYREKLELSSSPLGGLKASFRMPLSSSGKARPVSSFSIHATPSDPPGAAPASQLTEPHG